MAYCRWSSDNGYCDLYVYEDVSGGWTSHVASRRRPPGAPKDPFTAYTEGGMEAYLMAYDAWQKWSSSMAPIDIDHPDAGSSFNHETPGECAENLKRLKAEGLVIPDYVIEELMEEERERVDGSSRDMQEQG